MSMTAQEVQPVLPLWSQTTGASAELVNHSENQTFQIDTVGQGRFMLRVHRPHYQSHSTVESELAWLKALRQDTDLPIPEPVPGLDGQLLQRFSDTKGHGRMAVLFRHLPGREPTPSSNLGNLFGTLGAYAAKLHKHAIGWERPAGFQRQVWQAATILDADGPWGDWRLAPGVDATNRALLDRLDAALWLRLADYGTAPDRFGLIHADMRLGNLLVHGNDINLIDFDDCGFCWFAYDFAASISFHETNPAVPALKAAWLEGYQALRRLSKEDLDAIDAMVMLRRMALLAWIGSHSETELAQTHTKGFAQGTAELAERYLRGPIWPS